MALDFIIQGPKLETGFYPVVAIHPPPIEVSSQILQLRIGL